MPKNWKLKTHSAEALGGQLEGISPLMQRLLNNRGINDATEAEKFFNPKYESLSDPFLLSDMDKAVGRIWRAIREKEPVCIYGDYDADAVTANAVLQQSFRYLGVSAGSYIPDRFSEGYGLSIEAFEKLAAEGFKLVITVDCGTNSREVAAFCLSKGIDLIITDHHEMIGDPPEAYALINPKNPAERYPSREITGVGVAFLLAKALLAKTNEVRQVRQAMGQETVEGWEKWLLDLVAIGTVADCHSLLGENRILVKYGLKVLAKSKWPGLKALCKSAGLDFSQKAPDTYALGFVIAPRLNAAGRLKHADIALDLLMEGNEALAWERAQELENINKRRQELTELAMSEAREKAVHISERKVLALLGESWPKGIVGLVAGKLAEEYHKPVLVMEKQDKESTGSARSVGDFSIVEALKHASEHLVRFGGHKQAAGFTLKTEEFEAFYHKILEYAEKHLSESDTQKQLELEAELLEGDINLETFRLIGLFEPFGVENPRPKFLVQSCQVASLREVGNGQKHLQIRLDKGGREVAGIGFNLGYFAKTLKAGDEVDVAAELIEDGWNGRSSVKLKVIDIKESKI